MNSSQLLADAIRGAAPRSPLVFAFGVITKITGSAARAFIVYVSGIADEPIEVMVFSSPFLAELTALGQAAVGRTVEVHFIDSQPVIAYTTTGG